MISVFTAHDWMFKYIHSKIKWEISTGTTKVSTCKISIYCINYSWVDKQKNEPGRWKSGIVAILAMSDSSTRPDIWTSWCHAGITEHLKYGAWKWPLRVIRGLKIKSAWMLHKSMSDHSPWLENSKNLIISNVTHGSNV